MNPDTRQILLTFARRENSSSIQARRYLAIGVLLALVYFVLYMNKTWQEWRWILLVGFALLFVLAIVVGVQSRRPERSPVLVELLNRPNSVIRIVTHDKPVRVLLASGDEYSFFAHGADRARLLAALVDHSPNAETAAA